MQRGNRKLVTGAVIAAGVAGLLWVASGAIYRLLTWNSILGGSIGGIVPATIPLHVWARPQPWPILAALAGGIVVAVVHRAVTRLIPGTNHRRTVFLVGWFAAVVAGAVAGLSGDIATIITSYPPARLQMLLDGLGAHAAVGAYWGLVQGWIPALFLAFANRAVKTAAASTKVEPRLAGRVGWVIVAAAVVVAFALASTVGVFGQRAARTQTVQNAAIAEGYDSASGALPDPFANGTPVPSIAPGEFETVPEWCTPEQAMLLLGDREAATGHRMLPIELLNFSEDSCVVDGYPDIAFADQNGNALTVNIERGGSFMTTDPGVQRIEIPAGGSAITYLGWNANGTADSLIARTLHAAPAPGEARGSWPVQTDIVDGSTVAVTAWSHRPDSANSAG